MSDKFLPKKFKSDKDYRASVVESVRIVMSFGVQFPESVMLMLATIDLVILLL